MGRFSLLEFGRLKEMDLDKIIFEKWSVYWRGEFKLTWVFIGENTVLIKQILCFYWMYLTRLIKPYIFI